MAKGWKCERCSTQNVEGAFNCSSCGLIRGSVVVPGSYRPEPNVLLEPARPPLPPALPPESTPPSPEMQAAAEGVGAPLNLGPGEAQSSVGWVPPYPVAQVPARPIWRRIPIRLAIFGAIILAGAVAGFITNASRSSTGDITKSGDLTSNALRVGDCWDMKDASADTVDNVTARPCGETHKYEVFYIGSMAEGVYPTEDAFSTYVQGTCLPAFTTYVAMTYDESILDISWLYPGSEGWSAGDRTVECSVYDPNNDKLTGSVRGSRQ